MFLSLKKNLLNYLGVLINSYSQILECPREGSGKSHVPPPLTLLNLSDSYLLLLENWELSTENWETGTEGWPPSGVPTGCPTFGRLWVTQ